MYLPPQTKLKSIWIKDLNIKPVVFNQLEEKVGNRLGHMDTGDNLLKRTPVAQTLALTVDRWDSMKVKVSVRQIRQNGVLENGKISLLTPYPTKG